MEQEWGPLTMRARYLHFTSWCKSHNAVGATTSFKTLGTYDMKLPPQYACLSLLCTVYGGSHWQYVEPSEDSLKPLLVIVIESWAGNEWSFHCKLQWTLIHWWRVIWLKNKRVMMHGCKFHWRLHYSQSRDGSPPFGGAIAVMSLLPGAALNICMWNSAK
jgi:hypothetical protein